MRIPFRGRSYEQPILGALAGVLPGLLLAGCSLDGDPAGDGSARAPVGAAAVPAEVSLDDAVPSPPLGRWPAAAFGGNQYLVVWEDFRSRQPHLYGGRVAVDGTALDPLGFPILDEGYGDQFRRVYQPAVASDGTDFLVVTEEHGEIRGARVSAAGEVLDPGGFEIAAPVPKPRPSLVFGGDQYLVVWSQKRESGSPDNGIFLARVKPDGTVLDPGGVRVFAADAPSPVVGVSFDGTNFLLSWASFSPWPTPTVLHVARVAPDGVPIDAEPIRINPIGVDVRGGVGPRAAFDGTNHVIAWLDIVDTDADDEYRILASRVTPEGTVLDPDMIQAYGDVIESSAVHRLELVAGGGRSVALWSTEYHGDGGPRAQDLRAVEIAADGAVTMHPMHSFTAGLDAMLVAHAGGALLLWRHGEDVSSDYTPIIGRRLDAAGMPVPGQVSPASPASRQEVRAVASDGQDFFVVWADTRELRAEGQALFGARVAADGTLLDAEPIQLTTRDADLADVVFDGANYVVTWVELTAGESNCDPFQAVRVSPAGEVLDAEPLLPPLTSTGLTLDGASDGTHTLLIGRTGKADSQLAAVLLDQDGAVASEVVDIVVGDWFAYVREPAVSFAGAGYLVVWHREGQVLGQVVNTAGALVGQTFVIATRERIDRVAVSGGAGHHLVVWQGDRELMATRVSPDGQVLDPDGRLIAEVENICQDDLCCRFPDFSNGSCASVTFDGKSFVVAWREPSDPSDSITLDLFGAEVGTDALVLRTFAISEEPHREGAPFLAAGDVGQALAAYTRLVPGAPYDIRRAQARLLASEAPGPGPSPDAGPPGPAPDAGGSPVEPPGSPGSGDGCGCRAGADPPAPPASVLLLAVSMLWLVRRRSAR
jgi:MYXO-CTERM domain-containing protein